MTTMNNIMNQSWHYDHGPNHEEQAARPISINNCYITTVVHTIMEISEIKRLIRYRLPESSALKSFPNEGMK